MRKELPNELKPINMASPNFWDNAAEQLFENPTMILPVYLCTERYYIGEYFIGLVNEDNRLFLQAEGFSSHELELGFVQGSYEDWKKLQPGIYRLDITDFI